MVIFHRKTSNTLNYKIAIVMKNWWLTPYEVAILMKNWRVEPAKNVICMKKMMIKQLIHGETRGR